MFVHKTIDELLGMLKEPKLVYYDYTLGVPLGEALLHPLDDYRFWINQANHPLINLHKEMQKNNLDFLYDPVAEMVANALRHGNKNEGLQNYTPNGDPLKSLSMKIFTGDNGLLFRVRNEGEGFDYEKTLENLEKTGGFFQQRGFCGNGMKMLASPRFFVSYEDKGRATNLLQLYS